LPVPLPLVAMDDGRVFEILRNLSLATYLLEEFCEFCHQPGPTVLVDFRWDCVGSRCFTAGKLLHGPDCFWGLDGFEKVFHFIAVRIPLDFLSLSDHPGILHLPQPLPYKAAEPEEGCFGALSPKVHSEPHLGDDEAVICPNIGIVDRLGYQHVLSISPPDENIVQQMPAPLLRVHPRGLLPRRKVEEGVYQQETVFRTCSQKKEAVIVTATETVGTQHSLPGNVVHPDAGVEVTKDN
uniref:SPATA6 domain-containing protein n=1 Tax=Schistocephalus solidus TaxID=70667 RepID=A0A183TNM9_SCHSO